MFVEIEKLIGWNSPFFFLLSPILLSYPRKLWVDDYSDYLLVGVALLLLCAFSQFKASTI